MKLRKGECWNLKRAKKSLQESKQYDPELRFVFGGFKGYRYYNKQLDKFRSRRGKCKKKSRRYLYLSQVYNRVSERKRRKQHDCLHKASHLIALTG